jgi:N6-adenosine-specific RNA methylase IME4
VSKLSLSVQVPAKPAKSTAVQVLPGATPTALILPLGLSFEAWEGYGQTLGEIASAHQWWMGDWWRYGDQEYGERAAQAVDSRWSFQTWADAGWVAGAIGTSRRREVLSWSVHREVAALGPDEQDEWLDRAEAESWGHKDLRSAIKRSRVRVNGIGVLPPGKFAILLADPPWQYQFNPTDAARAIENHYPTLTADEIACFEDADKRPVADLAADDAVLFLWATNPKVAEALTVIEGWGFTYTTNLVWVKDRIGMGYWARQRHELLLVATRGEMSPPPESLRPDSVIEAPRTKHSEKPPAVHEFIDAIWPDAPKVEVFGRSARDGWSVFGNQVAE